MRRSDTLGVARQGAAFSPDMLKAGGILGYTFNDMALTCAQCAVESDTFKRITVNELTTTVGQVKLAQPTRYFLPHRDAGGSPLA